MCRKTTCSTCNKPTWAGYISIDFILLNTFLCILLYLGCGQHIEQALKDVPEDERCKCPKSSSNGICVLL